MIFQYLTVTVYLEFSTTTIIKRLGTQVQGEIDGEL